MLPARTVCWQQQSPGMCATIMRSTCWSVWRTSLRRCARGGHHGEVLYGAVGRRVSGARSDVGRLSRGVCVAVCASARGMVCAVGTCRNTKTDCFFFIGQRAESSPSHRMAPTVSGPRPLSTPRRPFTTSAVAGPSAHARTDRRSRCDWGVGDSYSQVERAHGPGLVAVEGKSRARSRP